MDKFQNEAFPFRQEDLNKTLENAMQVVQGKYEKLPDLLRDAGEFLLKSSKRLTKTQILLAVGVLAVGAAIIAINVANQPDEEEFEPYAGDVDSPKGLGNPHAAQE